RSNIDDAAPAGFHHALGYCARQTEHSRQIGVYDGLPVIIFHAHGKIVAGNTGVIHQNMGAAILLGQFSHQAFAGSRVIYIQHNAPPACGSQHFADGLRSGLGGCGTHHRGAASCQFQRNRLAYATGGAGYQGKLALELFVLHGYHPCKVSSAACSDAGSVIDKPIRSRSMRLVNPVSTLPGPHSTTCVTPWAFMACNVSTQRTGCQAGRTSASLMAAGSEGPA